MAQAGSDRRHRRWSVWAVAGLLWPAPLVAMRFTRDVAWTAADFAVWAAMLASAALAFELGMRKARAPRLRAGLAVAVAAGFLLVWTNLAVGVIGSENNNANLLYAGVLAVAVGGALLARFEPAAMARALVATAAAQVLVGAVALGAGLGREGASWPMDVIGATGVFTALWLLSAWLFGSAGRRQIAPG